MGEDSGPRRIVPMHKHYTPPIRPINRITAVMREDYRIFKAAGLFIEWRKKWAAYLPPLPS